MKVGRTTVCLCMCLCFSFQSCVWAIISGFEHIFHFKIPHLPILEYLDFPVTFETIFDIWLQIAKYHCLHQTLWKTFYHQFVFRNFEFYSWENKIGAGIKYFSILSLHFSQPGLKMTKIKFHPVWETYCAETLAYNVSQKLLLGAVLQSFKRRACFACLRACVRAYHNVFSCDSDSFCSFSSKFISWGLITVLTWSETKRASTLKKQREHKCKLPSDQSDK